jgi:mannose-6-phosphate isomerase-like protein (cupin superfamily)
LGAPHAQEALFGGKGEVLVWDLFGATEFAPFKAVLACELAPGGSVGTHRQEHFPEIVIVTEGEGFAVIDGERAEIQTGAVITLPLGSTLALENASTDAPLRYVIVKASD